MAHFYKAEEVEKLAKPIVRENHDHLIANQVRIEYWFRDDVPLADGRERWGEAKKITGFNARVAGCEDGESMFAILISQPIWDKMNERSRRALIDHELMHCGVEEIPEKKGGGIRLYIIPHDFEGFKSEFLRHGLWREDAKEMRDALQLAFKFETTGEIPEGATAPKKLDTSDDAMRRTAQSLGMPEADGDDIGDEENPYENDA